MRMWVLARPLSGFAETFSQYAVELAPDGGSDAPEVDPEAQSVIVVAHGTLTLNIDGAKHVLGAGGYAYIPPDTVWTIWNDQHAR